MEGRFRLRAPDGKEYGDLTEDLVRLWLEQGRIRRNSPLCREEDGVWKTLEALLGSAPAAAPAALPAPGEPPAVACLNHPGRAAVCTCSLCAESFCAECVDAPGAFATCRQCKAADARELEPRDGAATAAASEALTWALVSIFCFGFILGPVAFVKAVKAKHLAEENSWPSKGMGKATAAQWISGATTILNVLGLLRTLVQNVH